MEVDIMNQYVTGTIIKELRERNKMTQLQLADKLGVTDKTISPDLCTILWLAEGSHKNELVFEIPWLEETPVPTPYFPGRKRRFRIRPRTSEICSKSQEARCCPLRVCLHAWDEA